MTNWRVYAPLVNGGLFPRAEDDCRALLSPFIREDFEPEVVAVLLAGVTEEKREVEVRFDLATDQAAITIRPSAIRSHAGFAALAELKNGEVRKFFVDSGKQFLELFLGDDLRPPPRSLIFEIDGNDGHKVRLSAWPRDDHLGAVVDPKW